MQATLRLKLRVDEETASLLRETLEQFTASFNAVCSHGWRNDERNSVRLHHATYAALRAAHPQMPAQLVCAARAKATEALKSAHERARKNRAASCPQSRLCPIRYDARSHWVRLAEGVASLATVGGRVRVQFALCGYYQRYADWRTTSADLCYDAAHGSFFLHVVVEAVSPEADAVGVLGVDLGIVEIATDSEGNAYSGEQVKAVRRKAKRIRALLQSKGTPSAKRHLRRIRGKQSRFIRNTNHVISKHLVSTAAKTRKALALEDLTGIRERSNRFSREMRWLLGNWAFNQLGQYIAYKADAAGIPVLRVEARNTSRTCSRCGYCDKANRCSQAHFKCLQCGLEINADYNAALNVKARAEMSDGLLYRRGDAAQCASPQALAGGI